MDVTVSEVMLFPVILLLMDCTLKSVPIITQTLYPIASQVFFIPGHSLSPAIRFLFLHTLYKEKIISFLSFPGSTNQ